VLVVDDEPSIRLLCRINAELDGYDVLEASSLDEARGILAAGAIDIVLVDVHVGAEDGLELARELRDRPCAVALLTGSADLAPEDRALADAVIVKPFSIVHFLDTLRSLGNRVQSSA
jgi:DNA-binding response OmpR family regulator